MSAFGTIPAPGWLSGHRTSCETCRFYGDLRHRPPGVPPWSSCSIDGAMEARTKRGRNCNQWRANERERASWGSK